MGDVFQLMTVAQIKARLADLAEMETRHAARDLDAELGDVMRAGGDVDALEQAHLDAERAARRLRVERTALEAELPLALKREAQSSVAVLAEQHAALAKRASGAAETLTATWAAFAAAVEEWAAVQDKAQEATQAAMVLAEKFGADLPRLGWFNSNAVLDVAKGLTREEGRFARILSTAERGYFGVGGSHATSIDPPAAAEAAAR